MKKITLKEFLALSDSDKVDVIDARPKIHIECGKCFRCGRKV